MKALAGKNLFVKTPKSILKTAGKTLANKYVMMGTGLTAGAITAYDILKGGHSKGITKAREEMASGYVDLFVKSNSSKSYSPFLEKNRKFIVGKLFDNSVYPAYQKTKNVVKSTVGEVFNRADSVIATAGAIGAPILFKKAPKLASLPGASAIGVGIGAVCTGFLALKGASAFFGDILGFGKKGL